MSQPVSMKKRVIIMLCALAVLVALVVFVMIHNKQVADSQPEESSNSIVYKTLWNNNKEDIASIRLVSKLDTIVLNPTGEKTSDGQDAYVLEGHEDWKLSHLYQNLVSLSTIFQAYKKIEDNVTDPDRLNDFGLKDPTVLTVTMKDGSSMSMDIGNVSSDGTYAFCRMEGDNTVYACNSTYAGYASYTMSTLRLNTITEIDTTNGTLTELYVHKKGSRPVHLKLKDDGGTKPAASGQATYITSDLEFVEPYQNTTLEVAADLSTTYFKKLVTPEVVETVDPNCSDFSKYGLTEEDPEYRETITTRSGTEGNYTYNTTDYLFGYVYGDSSDRIYFREADSSLVLGVDVSCMDDRQWEPFDFVNKLMFLKPITSVETGSITFSRKAADSTGLAGGECTHNFVIKREDIDSESSVAAEDVRTSYQMDDKLVTTDSFGGLYRAMIEIAPKYEIDDQVPQYDPDDKMEFTLNMTDGTSFTLTYYRMDEFYYVTKIDDHTWFTTSVDDIKNVADKLQPVLDSMQEKK